MPVNGYYKTFAAVMLYSGQTSNTLPFPLYLCIINDASSIYVVPVKLHVQFRTCEQNI